MKMNPLSCAVVIVMLLGLLIAAQESASQTAIDDERSFFQPLPVTTHRNSDWS
jgi:hypothetical protein